MSEGVTIAIVTAVPVTLAAIGGGIKYTVSLVLDAYKAQAESTVLAKDQELAAQRLEIERLRGEVTSALSAIRTDVAELRDDVRQLLRERDR